jgi:hypothetical protein
MPKVASAFPPVHRHDQDTGTACGRACVQMVVASLTGRILDQQQLRDLEPRPRDVTGWWFSEPDELQFLLKHAPQVPLPPSLRDWRIASDGDPYRLAARMALGLDPAGGRRPSLVTESRSNHWGVVHEAYYADDGSVVLKYFNPLPSDRLLWATMQPAWPEGVPPPNMPHGIGDTCSQDAGLFTSAGYIVDPASSPGAIDFVIDALPLPSPPYNPIPAGPLPPGFVIDTSAITPHLGRAVAVVFGDVPPAAVQTLGDTLRTRLRLRAPGQPWQRLHDVARQHDLVDLGTMLEAADLVRTAPRRVRYLSDAGKRFQVLTAVAPSLGAGLAAVFSDAAQPALLHFRLLRLDERFQRAHDGVQSGADLYWVDQVPRGAVGAGFEYLRQSCFVFRRANRPDGAYLVRDFDGFAFRLP